MKRRTAKPASSPAADDASTSSAPVAAAALAKPVKPCQGSSGRPLYLKRFPKGLTPGACRSRVVHPHDAAASYAPSTNALCRVCDAKIAKGLPRVALYLQCHLGYKDPCLTHYVHVPCLARHPEAYKLERIDEVAYAAKVFSKEDIGALASVFKQLESVRPALTAAAAACTADDAQPVAKKAKRAAAGTCAK